MIITCPGCPNCPAEGQLSRWIPVEEGERLLAMARGMEPVETVSENGVRVSLDPLAVVVHGSSRAALAAATPAGRLSGCPPDCHAHPPAIRRCDPKCREHRAHIYIICYGKPTVVRDRDYLRADGDAWGSGYPITHYVGFTTQVPVDRVRQHAALSAHYLVEVRPGGGADELNAKLYEKCPRCGGSLWYFAESPTYKRRYRRQAIRRQRQWMRELPQRRRVIQEAVRQLEAARQLDSAAGPRSSLPWT